MRGRKILLLICSESMESHEEMSVDEISMMNRLVSKSLYLMRKGDEGLLELYDWLDGNTEISYEDALLLLFDYLGIQQKI